MSRHYEERYYVKDEREMIGDYEDHHRSTSRARSSSRHNSRHRQPQEGQYYRQKMTSGSGSSMSSVSDYEGQGRERPLVRCPRDVIRAPTPPPVIQRVVERAPTPEADVVERVIVRPQPQQLIERIIERPRTPPPKIIDKEICEPAPPPIVRTRIVKVDHSPRHYYAAQQARVNPTTSRYESGYDYDYSGGGYNNSFSTTEAHPVQSYLPTAASAYPSTYQGQVSSAMYPGTSNVQQQQYYSQAVPATNPYGYTYGYAAQPQTSRQQNYDPRAQQYNQRQY